MKSLKKIFLILLSIFVNISLHLPTKIAFAENKVLTGLDILKKDNFSHLKNKNVGIIINHTSIDNNGNYILDILEKQKEFTLKAIFTPEHGLRGNMDQEYIPSESYKDIPVYSLYGEVKKPTDGMLKGIDTIIFDIQDIGTRYYTYTTTMAYAMEAASKNNIEFIVLDRPNPVTGNIVEGEVMDMNFRNFTGYFPISTRHGMTIGEIANFYNNEEKLKLNLKIIKMENWKRNMWFDETGLKWINPSPNMRSLEAAILYPGLGSLESTNLSVGRGTDKPFIYYGAPWLDNKKIISELEKMDFPGLKFSEFNFIPVSSVNKNELNKGFKVEITDKNKVRSVNAFVHIIELINTYHSDKLKKDRLYRSFGSKLLNKMLDGEYTSNSVIEIMNKNKENFLKTRSKYLLY